MTVHSSLLYWLSLLPFTVSSQQGVEAECRLARMMGFYLMQYDHSSGLCYTVGRKQVLGPNHIKGEGFKYRYEHQEA